MKKSWAGICILTIFIGLLISAGIGKATTVFMKTENFWVKHQIVIDPGHGGQDGGAISCTGVPESQINLEISIRLRDLFNLLGYNTTMTRDTDVSLHTEGDSISQKKISDLKERVKMISELPDGLLISIHQNSFPETQYCGAQVFYSDHSGSKELAQMMQAEFVRTINPNSNREAKKSNGIYIMKNIKKPGVLVECGFLSNREEERLLKNPEYQKRICCIIASTVARYLYDT